MFVSDRDFAAGDHLTIADLSLMASASTMEVKTNEIVALDWLISFIVVPCFHATNCIQHL